MSLFDHAGRARLHTTKHSRYTTRIHYCQPSLGNYRNCSTTSPSAPHKGKKVTSLSLTLAYGSLANTHTHTHAHTMAVPKLEKHFTMRIYLCKENIYDLKAMRNGPHRHIAAITRGFIKGEGFEAEILPGGADWVSVCIIQCPSQPTPTSYLPIRPLEYFVLTSSPQKARPLNRHLPRQRPHPSSHIRGSLHLRALHWCCAERRRDGESVCFRRGCEIYAVWGS